MVIQMRMAPTYTEAREARYSHSLHEDMQLELSGPWGGLLIEPRLKEIVRDESPDILFLCETISKCDVVSDQAVVLGFDNVFSVPPVGRSGGLAIL